MGMFDTVYCEYPLPDPAHQALDFQTKDLESLMLTYLITEEGRLVRRGGRRGNVARDVEWPLHGDLRIYTSLRDPKQWIEYRFRFTHGRVESVHRVETPEPGAPQPPKLPVAGRADSGPLPEQGETEEAADRSPEETLLATLRARSTELRALLDQVSSHWGYEDPVYRFYHQSMKVYWLQESTERIVDTLERLLPGRELHPWFRDIVAAGTGHTFTLDDNARWTEVTRPILEAFFHARYFLEMAVRHASTAEPPQLLPSGYAALLCLYRLR